MSLNKEERPLSALISDLTRETSTLVRKEVALARNELGEKVAQVEHGIVALLAGALVAFAGFLVLLAAAVFALSEVIPAWLSALIVGVIVAAIGAALLVKARADLKARNLAPSHTLHSLHRDKVVAKEQLT